MLFCLLVPIKIAESLQFKTILAHSQIKLFVYKSISRTFLLTFTHKGNELLLSKI